MKDLLKQRLVGAVVLAALAVIFLPGFFKEQQAYQVDTSTRIPPQPTVPQLDFQPPQPIADTEPAPDPETMFLPPEPEAVEPQDLAKPSAVIETAEPATAGSGEVPKLPLNADGIPDAWVVQVASLTNQDAANKLRDELQAQGHKAYVRSVTGASGKITRVFIGPKLDKAEALAVKTQIDKHLKVNSMVKRFEP